MNPNPQLLVTDANGVRTLTLNRPERRNAVDTTLGRALLDALRAADQDASVGAVLLAATGTVFCAGADLGEFKGERADPAAQGDRSDLFLSLQLAFEDVRVPIVSAVRGAAIGMGASLAIAADLTVLGESARMSWPEVLHGMVPTLVLPHLQHRTSRKQAYELLALGAAVDARHALTLGLANRVVPDAEVHATALQLASALAQGKRGALREIKELFVSLAPLPLPDALREARAFARRSSGEVTGTR